MEYELPGQNLRALKISVVLNYVANGVITTSGTKPIAQAYIVSPELKPKLL